MFDGVPEHLAGPLKYWLEDYLGRPADDAAGVLRRRVAMRLRLRFVGRIPGAYELVSKVDHVDRLLDVVDAAVHLDESLAWEIDVVGMEPIPEAGLADWIPEARWPQTSTRARKAAELNELLRDAGSAYIFDWDSRRLVRRVELAASAAAEGEFAAGGAAGEHMLAAWNAAYGPVVSMIGLLWEGHARHAGTPGFRPQRHDEAVMAVYLAITLVQWFRSGAVLRRPDAG